MKTNLKELLNNPTELSNLLKENKVTLKAIYNAIKKNGVHHEPVIGFNLNQYNYNGWTHFYIAGTVLCKGEYFIKGNKLV